ncbi:hypothetical protein PFISCL1PPCAC_18868, partial [Pristionchus fissidentatus]
FLNNLQCNIDNTRAYDFIDAIPKSDFLQQQQRFFLLGIIKILFQSTHYSRDCHLVRQSLVDAVSIEGEARSDEPLTETEKRHTNTCIVFRRQFLPQNRD